MFTKENNLTYNSVMSHLQTGENLDISAASTDLRPSIPEKSRSQLPYVPGSEYMDHIATNEERLSAIGESLDNLTWLVENPDYEGRLTDVLSLVDSVMNCPELCEDTELVNFICQFAVCVVDVEYADNMNSGDLRTTLHRNYMRGESSGVASALQLTAHYDLKKITLLSQKEKECILNSYTDDEDLYDGSGHICNRKVGSLGELYAALEVRPTGDFVVMTDLSARETLDVMYFIKRKGVERDVKIIVPQKYDDNLSGIVILGNLPGEDRFELSDSTPPIQSVYRYSIEKGLSFVPTSNGNSKKKYLPRHSKLFDGKDPRIPEDRQYITEDFLELFDRGYSRNISLPKEERLLARKWSVYLKNPERALSALSESHKDFYHHSFVEGRYKGFHRGETVLTRSGLSSNEIAAHMAYKIIQQNTYQQSKALILPDYYYENTATLKTFFDTSEDPAKSNVFFISHDPCIPVIDDAPSANYSSVRENLLTTVVARAVHQPDEVFVLVYDKTSDPNTEVLSGFGELPKNLRIIETASFSKHQRGGRNYFFGSVFSWCTPEEQGYLTEASRMGKGSLFPESIIHFPHKTPGEIKRDILEKQKFAHQLRDFWNEKGDPYLRLEAYNFFAYLVPKTGDLLRGVSSDVWRTKIYEVMGRLQEISKTEPSLEVGDSFGLSNARLTGLTVGSSSYTKTRIFSSLPTSIYFARLSFGEQSSNKALLESLKARF